MIIDYNYMQLCHMKKEEEVEMLIDYQGNKDFLMKWGVLEGRWSDYASNQALLMKEEVLEEMVIDCENTQVYSMKMEDLEEMSIDYD